MTVNGSVDVSEHAEDSEDGVAEQPDVHPSLYWKESTVSITTRTGRHAVPALETPLVPGLAVTMANFGKFAVTHVVTGRRIAGQFRREANARLQLLSWARFADWRQDADALKAEISRRREENAPLPVYGVSINGVSVDHLPYAEAYEQLRDHIPFLDEFPWEGEDCPERMADEAFDFLVAQVPALVAEIVNAAELAEKLASG